jgi:hypothetical protein
LEQVLELAVLAIGLALATTITWRWYTTRRRFLRYVDFASVRREADLRWPRDREVGSFGANAFLMERDPEALAEVKRRKFLEKKLLLPLYLDTDLVSALYQQAETPFRLTKLVEERSDRGTADLALQIPPLKAGAAIDNATRSVAEYEGKPSAPYAQIAAVLRYSIQDITFGLEDQSPPRLDDDFENDLRSLLESRGLQLSDDVIATIRRETEAKQIIGFKERLVRTTGFVAVHGRWEVAGDLENGRLTMTLKLEPTDVRITARVESAKLLSGARKFIEAGQHPDAWVVGWAVGDVDSDQSLGVMAVAVIA